MTWIRESESESMDPRIHGESEREASTIFGTHYLESKLLIHDSVKGRRSAEKKTRADRDDQILT